VNRTSSLVGAVLSWSISTAAALAADSRWSVEAGAAQVAVEGIRTYAVPTRKLASNDRNRVPAGFVRVARNVGSAWNVGLSYTRFGQLLASGESWDSDIFDLHNGLVLPAVVPLTMMERIQEWSLDARRLWQLSPRWTIAAGPVVSYFHSEAELGSQYFRVTVGSTVVQPVFFPIAHYRGDDLRLGGVADLKFALSVRWSATVGYRYAAPPARSLHIGSVAVSRRF
jgi:hypothetical protein